MYSRYVPQPDGSYRRNHIPDPIVTAPQPPPPPEPEACPAPEPPPREPARKKPPANPKGGFLQQLLPKDFDTGDLIVILLLLLMAGDSQEDKNTALLTLAFYFLM